MGTNEKSIQRRSKAKSRKKTRKKNFLVQKCSQGWKVYKWWKKNDTKFKKYFFAEIAQNNIPMSAIMLATSLGIFLEENWIKSLFHAEKSMIQIFPSIVKMEFLSTFDDRQSVIGNANFNEKYIFGKLTGWWTFCEIYLKKISLFW